MREGRSEGETERGRDGVREEGRSGRDGVSEKRKEQGERWSEGGGGRRGVSKQVGNW